MFINTVFNKLNYKKKRFTHKFKKISNNILSKYSYLFKRKLSLFYSRFDNKYLFIPAAQRTNAIKKVKKKLSKLEFFKKNLLSLRNMLLKSKKRFYAAFSQKRRIIRLKRKYFIKKRRKKYFKHTGELFPYLLIHFNKVSDAFDAKQVPNFNAKYAFRNYYLIHLSQIFTYKFPKKLQFKVKKQFFKSKFFKKTELTFLRNQLSYYIPALSKLCDKPKPKTKKMIKRRNRSIQKPEKAKLLFFKKKFRLNYDVIKEEIA